MTPLSKDLRALTIPLCQLCRLPQQEQPVFDNRQKQQKKKNRHSDPNLSLEKKRLISMNALKIHNQMKIFKRGWWKEINQVIQISKIGQVIQLAENYCIRKAVGSLRYTVSVSTGAGMRTCLSRSRQSWLSRSADNNAITVIPSSLSVSPVKKQSASFPCCGYGWATRTVQVHGKSILYMVK